MSIRPWLYFVAVTAALAFACYTLYDLQQDIKRTTAGVRESNEMIREKLPLILDNTRKASEALVTLTSDVAVLKNLIAPATPTEGQDTPISLAKFAGTVVDLIEKSETTISSRGSSAKPAREWAVSERKEALLLAFRVGARREMVEKISTTMFGNPWVVTTKTGDKLPMVDWLRKHHPDIDSLFSGRAVEKPK
jgi:hypothetical protein